MKISYFFCTAMFLQFHAAAGIIYPSVSNHRNATDQGLAIHELHLIKHMEIFIAQLDTPANGIETVPPEKVRKTRGYIGIIEVNYGAGIGKVELYKYPEYQDLQVNSFGFKFVNGYHVDEHLTVGLGVGIDAYNNIRYPMMTFYMPVSADIRFVILKNKFSPVINLNTGYSVGLSGLNGGVLMNPSIGFTGYTSGNNAVVFNVGYKWQGMLLPIPDSNAYGGVINALSQNVTLEFITFNIGCSF
jgi:hypothetical protein